MRSAIIPSSSHQPQAFFNAIVLAPFHEYTPSLFLSFLSLLFHFSHPHLLPLAILVYRGHRKKNVRRYSLCHFDHISINHTQFLRKNENYRWIFDYLFIHQRCKLCTVHISQLAAVTTFFRTNFSCTNTRVYMYNNYSSYATLINKQQCCIQKLQFSHEQNHSTLMPHATWQYLI